MSTVKCLYQVLSECLKHHMMHEHVTPLPSMGLEWHILCVQQDLNTATLLQTELYNYYITKENSPSTSVNIKVSVRSLALVMQMSA